MHEEAVIKWETHVKIVDASNMVHANYNKKQQENKMMLVKIVDRLKWLARQGLAIRVHSSESGNFIQLLKLRGCIISITHGRHCIASTG